MFQAVTSPTGPQKPYLSPNAECDSQGTVNNLPLPQVFITSYNSIIHTYQEHFGNLLYEWKARRQDPAQMSFISQFILITLGYNKERSNRNFPIETCAGADKNPRT